MALKDKLMAEGMKLAGNPQVAKLMQDERFMKLVMTAMSMPGKVSTFTTEQKEHFAKAMGLATQEEVRDLKRTVAALERAVARLEGRRPERAPEPCDAQFFGSSPSMGPMNE